MATRVILTPLSAAFNAITPAELSFIQTGSSDRLPMIRYASDENRSALWSFVAPVGLTGTLTAVLQYVMLTVASGDVSFLVDVEAVTPGDSLDISTDDFDSSNVGTQTVAGTPLFMQAISITLTNKDSIAAGDWVLIRVTRDIGGGLDTAGDDCCILTIEFRDAA